AVRFPHRRSPNFHGRRTTAWSCRESHLPCCCCPFHQRPSDDSRHQSAEISRSICRTSACLKGVSWTLSASAEKATIRILDLTCRLANQLQVTALEMRRWLVAYLDGARRNALTETALPLSL